VNATSQPAVPLKEQIARTIAILIILTGIIDPVFSVTRSVPPVVALLSADSSRHAPLLQRVRQRLSAQATVVAGPTPGADVQVVVGSRLPITVASDTIASFVVATPTRQGFHVEQWTAPTSVPLDGRTTLQVRVARDAGAVRRMADTARATLELREDGALVATQAVSLTPASRTTTGLPYVPTRVGTHMLDVRLIDGADTLHWRHPMHARATPWRVLVYDARPSWLSTFVRRAVERDDRFVVSSRVVTSRQISRATTQAAGSLAAVERLASLPDVLIVGAPDALSAADVAALDRLMLVHGLSVLLLPDHLLANGTLSAVHNGLDAILGTGTWRLLPALPSNVPRAVHQRSGFVSVSDSVHLLATAIAIPQRLPTDAEPVADLSPSPGDSPAPVVWRVPHGRGTLLVSSAFDAWRFRDEGRSTFDGTWRDLVADAALRRAPRITFVAPSAGNDAPRSRMLRIDPSGTRSDARPIVQRIGPTDTVLVRLLPTHVANTWRATWPPIALPHGATAHQAVLLRGIFAGDTAFVSLLPNDTVPPPPDDRPIEQLAAWAQSRGGRVLPASAIDSLAGLVATAVGDRRHTAPWHPMRSGWWIVPLALAFGTEWWLRRRRGSP